MAKKRMHGPRRIDGGDWTHDLVLLVIGPGTILVLWAMSCLVGECK